MTVAISLFGRRRGRVTGAVLLALLMAGCAPSVQEFGPSFAEPSLQDDSFITADGKRLPLQLWPAQGRRKAVLVALHGFNMYSRYFEDMAPWLAARGIATYAYDQRGFGGAPARGIWGGIDAMAADARDMLRLVHARHPGVPLFALGSSMGAAVLLSALAADDAPTVDGAVLVAPAVWGGEAMHPFFRFGLWLSAHTTPWNRATGSGLRRRPSDNDAMLRALGQDPQVIRYTRIDTVYGMSQLMGHALAAAPRPRVPILVLYGEKDEIIPPRPVELMVSRLTAPYRLVRYADGWHMLLRDLQAETVWRDIAQWVLDPEAPLPSGQEARGQRMAGR